MDCHWKTWKKCSSSVAVEFTIWRVNGVGISSREFTVAACFLKSFCCCRPFVLYLLKDWLLLLIVWICSAVSVVCGAPVWLHLVEERSAKYLNLYVGSCHKRRKTNVIFISRQLALPLQRFTFSGVAAVSPPSNDSGSLSHRAEAGWGFLLAGLSEPKAYIWLRSNHFEMSEMWDDEGKLRGAFWIHLNSEERWEIWAFCL